MLKIILKSLILILVLQSYLIIAQQKFPTLISSSLEDEIVILSVDKHVYFPGNTITLTLQRNDSTKKVFVTPILIIDGTTLKAINNNIYSATIPQSCAPGLYRVRLRVQDAQGRSFVFETDCTIIVEEYQEIEQLCNYVSIEPVSGSLDIESAYTLSRAELQNLRVVFKRDQIRIGMGPQFVTIRTTVLSRDGSILQSFERRVLTFRSDSNPNRDRAMLIQYRNAYGAYAAIRSEEFTQVRIHMDSLPGWSVIKINIEPDYTIKIGGYDRSNSFTRYFRVKGPTIEVGFSLGIPKVFFDSQPKDSLNYGNSSAMVRFYYVNGITGNRFPVNLGFGTFGVNSPLDVNINRGGFALSFFLDVAEILRIIGVDFIKNITAGIEIAPFFPISNKARFLIDAQVSLTL